MPFLPPPQRCDVWLWKRNTSIWCNVYVDRKKSWNAFRFYPRSNKFTNAMQSHQNTGLQVDVDEQYCNRTGNTGCLLLTDTERSWISSYSPVLKLWGQANYSTSWTSFVSSVVWVQQFLLFMGDLRGQSEQMHVESLGEYSLESRRQQRLALVLIT